jgi:hypothetical protein
VDKHGRPADPTETELPDTLDCELPEAVGGKVQLFVPANIVSAAPKK